MFGGLGREIKEVSGFCSPDLPIEQAFSLALRSHSLCSKTRHFKAPLFTACLVKKTYCCPMATYLNVTLLGVKWCYATEISLRICHISQKKSPIRFDKMHSFS